MSSPEWLTVNEAVAAYRLSRPTLYRLVRAGQLPSARVGHKVLIRAADIEALLSSGGVARVGVAS